ncbi:plant basic secretory protein [Hysterangium stoloniferum]|nr:plant basic secretory protein [Hysterangium stoloniferum]
MERNRNYQPAYLPHPSAVPNPYLPYQPVQKPVTTWLMPRLSLKIDDLSDPAIEILLTHVKPYEAMRNAVIQVLESLYTIETQPRNVASITLILRDFAGAAHAIGNAANNADKEIHFSTRHIQASISRAQQEILGVLTHEMVHCFQYDAQGTCPAGLVEGIADFVRLRSGLNPPHWTHSRPSGSDKWDDGYAKTAWFLDWVEQVHGVGVVRAINEGMRKSKYENGQVWRDVTGRSVDDLWVAYKSSF